MAIKINPLNAVQHYENFPVASLLLPAHAVPAVLALYRFARTADDIADEGNASYAERLEALQQFESQLGTPHQASNQLILDCAPFIEQNILPVQYLHDLLAAFIQDVQQDMQQNVRKNVRENMDAQAEENSFRHANMASLLRYCAHSANPVGRLMLHAVGLPWANCNAASFAASDAICTSLQLINFWQDLSKDAAQGRVYIPHDVYTRHGCPTNSSSESYLAMMHELCSDARNRMLAGTALLKHLKGRFKAEVALTMAGGLCILNKLQANRYDTANKRPKLHWTDAPACLGIVWRLYRGTLK